MSFLGKAIGKLTGADAAADAASNAAATQAASAQAGIDEQRRQFDAMQQMMQPFMQAATGAGGSPVQSIVDMYQRYMGRAPNAGTLAQWVQQISSGDKTLADAERIISSGSGAQAYALSGNAPQGSLDAQRDLAGLNGPEAQQAAIAGIQGSPAFTSMVQQGENGILQNASATGGLRGGNAQGALAQFRPQLLAQLIEQQYGRLGGLTSMGQNAAAGTGNAGMQTGANVAQLLQQQGAATAGGQMAQGSVARTGFGDLLKIGGMVGGLF